jgi:hypothetical protein
VLLPVSAKWGNTQTTENFCFGVGHVFSESLPPVSLAGNTVSRWYAKGNPSHVFYTTPAPECQVVMEQGFGGP